MSLEELRLLEEYDSKYQNIKFYENKDKQLILALDSYMQFVEGEELDVYHKEITKPSKKAKITEDFLILGGGDGLVARELFELYKNPKITLVELDEKVIELFKNKERLVNLNNNSLNKCNIVIQDCKKWIKENDFIKFDVIILDLPDANSKELESLYTLDFLKDVFKLLKEGGVQIQQSHMDVAEDLENKYKQLFKEVTNKHCKMPELTGINMIVGIK